MKQNSIYFIKVFSSVRVQIVLILGISGALRRDELTKITFDGIQDKNSVLIVTGPDTKTDIKRTYTNTNSDYIRLYRE